MRSSEAHQPRILFFSGGTALKELSAELAEFTPNSCHLITPFDSGGSSGALRRFFAMPAVGDLRNRLLVLARPGPDTISAIRFCDTRFPPQGDPDLLRERLYTLAEASQPCWTGMPPESSMILRRFLDFFLRRMPADFDARLASMGNLLIAGAYLEWGRDFSPVIGSLSKVLRVRGTVLPTVNVSLHLGATLSDGTRLLGQHQFGLSHAPVRHLFLSVHERMANLESLPVECRPPLATQATAALERADMIVYGMGSFFSSLLANLLPAGVGRCAAASRALKIFVPNSGCDPEAPGLDIMDQTRWIIELLRRDCGQARPDDLLNIVLVDPLNGHYVGGCGKNVEQELAGLGIRLLRVSGLVKPGWEGRRHDAYMMAQTLMDLAG